MEMDVSKGQWKETDTWSFFGLWPFVSLRMNYLIVFFFFFVFYVTWQAYDKQETTAELTPAKS